MGIILGALGRGLDQAGTAGGEYVAKSSLLEEQNAATLARETTLEKLKAQLKNQETRVVAPGSTVHTPGQPDFQAPDTHHPQQLLDYYGAHAEEAKARAKALLQAGNTKDLPASVKVYVDTLGKSLQALDREEATGMLDEKGRATLDKRRTALNAQLITTLTTGQLPEGAGPGPAIKDPFAAKPPAPAQTTAPAAPVAVAPPAAAERIPPQFIGGQVNRKVNPAYAEFVRTYGEPPAQFLGRGVPNPAYAEWEKRVTGSP